LLSVKLDGLSTAAANILKQTALVCGGDCAVHRGIVSGRVRKSDVALFIGLRQLPALLDRLARQPECVARLAPELAELSRRVQSPTLAVKLGQRALDLGARARVMGVLNVTPDSFSDGGRFLAPQAALEQAVALAEAGADFIDIGAESTRPGARPVCADEQLNRLGPVLPAVKKRVKIPLSIDTTSAAVAEWALQEGAELVNDVSAFGGDSGMSAVVARARVPCILMHMRGRPRSMQRSPRYQDLMAEICGFLAAAMERGQQAGIERGQMLVDPGIGFGKLLAHNLEILRRLPELGTLGAPIVVGPSRKRFIGDVLGLAPEERLEGTIAACVHAAANGASILRVHDVRPVARALRLAEAIRLGPEPRLGE
ncbi:dihydropteroate synthase, partial [candidate division WOR-3 bacterium]|nr:dihydropteroate synthase [candidate division WOR-3 bacterium]